MHRISTRYLTAGQLLKSSNGVHEPRLVSPFSSWSLEYTIFRRKLSANLKKERAERTLSKDNGM